MRYWAVVACLCWAGVPGVLRADDWPRFRGPDGRGVSQDQGVPATWGAAKNLAWKTALPGPGTSSPIVLGDRVYLTCYQAAGAGRLTRQLVCLDRARGTVRWTRDVPGPDEPRTRDDHGYASSTPAADRERVYVFFGKAGVFAFDHDGKQLWHAEVGSGLNGWGSAASPVLFEDLLIVNASVEGETLLALDRRTGKPRWRVAGIKEAWNTPALVTAAGGKAELAVAVPQKVLGFDPRTGERLWSCNTAIGWYMVPSMVAHDGVVYCTGGRSGNVGALAVKAGGRGDVTATHRLWTSGRRSNVSSPVYHAGHLYFAQDQLGIVYCLDARTGATVYEERLPGTAGQIYASPVLADGRLYFVTRRGGTFVVAAEPRFALLAHNTLDDRSTFNASPAVSDGQLLLRSDRYLYCIGGK